MLDQAFLTPHAWRKEGPECFVHETGLALHLTPARIDPRLFWVFGPSIRHCRRTRRYGRRVHIRAPASRYLGYLCLESGPSLEAFQHALDAQWGGLAQRRLRAMAHITAVAFDLDGGCWTKIQNGYLLDAHGQTPFNDEDGADKIEFLINSARLSERTKNGLFKLCSFLRLTRLSQHAQLELLEELRWAQDALRD